MSGTDEREQIKDALRRLALGQEQDVSGREVQARVAALRKLEWMTRPEDEPSPEPPQERLDFPVSVSGKFDPSCQPSFWPCDLAWRWEAGSEREAEALERWLKSPDGQRRWIREGRPWPRSRWEVDRGPWERALAGEQPDLTPNGSILARGRRAAS